MSTEARSITVAGIRVEVVRKAIRNLHLAVYPPDGRVRVAVPLVVSDDAVRLAVVGRLGWIRKQQARFERQPREATHELLSGESHHFQGRRYLLRVVETAGAAGVVIRNRKILELHVRPGSTVAARTHVLQRWYRERLRELAGPLVSTWEQRLGVRSTGFFIRTMKTKWGSCGRESRRIWLNLELAKKGPECLEYVVVHELAHLMFPTHGDDFVAMMNRHLPRWRTIREALNEAPLAHEEWARGALLGKPGAGGGA